MPRLRRDTVVGNDLITWVVFQCADDEFTPAGTCISDPADRNHDFCVCGGGRGHGEDDCSDIVSELVTCITWKGTFPASLRYMV
jgi:hypothetical protein